MKLIKTIIFTLSCLLFSYASLQAQSDAIERDIRIGEGILTELFSEDKQPSFTFRTNSNTVTGEYLPGYGVHFNIGGNGMAGVLRLTGAVRVTRDKEGRQTVQVDSASGNDESSTPESIESRITEYLTQYASSIRGLPGDEHVRVSYGLYSQPHRVIAPLPSGEHQHPENPKISLWIKATDLQQHREGNITDQQLKNRIRKADLSGTKETRDFNIFAAVLEASINSSDLDHIRANRKPVFNYIPEMGVHFHINASSRGSFGFYVMNNEDFEFDFSSSEPVDFQKEISFQIDDSIEANFNSKEFEAKISSLEETMDSLKASLPAMMDSLKIALPKMKENLKGILRTAEDAPEPEEVEAEKERFTDLIIETLNDYGSTLTSLPENELIMITVNWTGSRHLPHQTKFRITKNDLLTGGKPAIEEFRRR